MYKSDDSGQDPWTLLPSKKRYESIPGPFPTEVEMVYSNQLYIHKDALPPAIINRLIRLAAFQNPEFYRAQALRG